MRESPWRRRGPSSCEAIMGTRSTWCQYRWRKAAGSRSRSVAYLQFMGRQAYYERPSISARLAVAVPSSPERKVTGGA